MGKKSLGAPGPFAVAVADEICSHGRSVNWLAKQVSSGRTRVYDVLTTRTLAMTVDELAEFSAALGLDPRAVVIAAEARMRAASSIDDVIAQMESHLFRERVMRHVRGLMLADPELDPTDILPGELSDLSGTTTDAEAIAVFERWAARQRRDRGLSVPVGRTDLAIAADEHGDIAGEQESTNEP